jgi:hypothetical protein
MAEEPRRAAADVARSDLISWSSIFAGVLSAFGLFVLLSAVALASGLEADQPKFGREVGLILSGLFVVVAFLAGGFITVWTAEVDEPESAILHGFLVWGLFVVLLMALMAAGLGAAIGSAGNVFSAAFEPTDADALSNAAWGSVFALVLAATAAILGGLLATRDEIRRRWPFAR